MTPNPSFKAVYQSLQALNLNFLTPELGFKAPSKAKQSLETTDKLLGYQAQRIDVRVVPKLDIVQLVHWPVQA